MKNKNEKLEIDNSYHISILPPKISSIAFRTKFAIFDGPSPWWHKQNVIYQRALNGYIYVPTVNKLYIIQFIVSIQHFDLTKHTIIKSSNMATRSEALKVIYPNRHNAT